MTMMVVKVVKVVVVVIMLMVMMFGGVGLKTPRGTAYLVSDRYLVSHIEGPPSKAEATAPHPQGVPRSGSPVPVTPYP